MYTFTIISYKQSLRSFHYIYHCNFQVYMLLLMFCCTNINLIHTSHTNRDYNPTYVIKAIPIYNIKIKKLYNLINQL